MTMDIPGFTYTGMYQYSWCGISHTVEEYRHDRIGMEFVLLPGGRYTMGYNACHYTRPSHEVVLEPFLMAKYECTNAQFKLVTGYVTYTAGEDFPVAEVSHAEAMAFCERAGLVLPSESQWEYTCRAGLKKPQDMPGRSYGEYGWFETNSGYEVHPVGQKRPNAFGLYDMMGNVDEWCRDVWAVNYRSAPSDGSPQLYVENELIPGSYIIRGGNYEEPYTLFLPWTGRSWASRGHHYVGFRCAYNLKKRKKR